MILQLGLKPKIPDQRKELDCSEFMFKTSLGISRVTNANRNLMQIILSCPLWKYFQKRSHWICSNFAIMEATNGAWKADPLSDFWEILRVPSRIAKAIKKSNGVITSLRQLLCP